MRWGGREMMGVAVLTLLGAGLAAALSSLLHAQSPEIYQSVATLYMPAGSEGDVGLAPPPEQDLPPIDRYTSAAMASLRMPDYATLARSATVAERVAERLQASAPDAEGGPGAYSTSRVRGALQVAAQQHWSGVYQVIYQRTLELRVRWPESETASLVARIWAEEATAFLAEIEGAEEPPLIVASVPNGPGVAVGVPAGRAIAAGAFLGGLFAFLAGLAVLCVRSPAQRQRHA